MDSEEAFHIADDLFGSSHISSCELWYGYYRSLSGLSSLLPDELHKALETLVAIRQLGRII